MIQKRYVLYFISALLLGSGTPSWAQSLCSQQAQPLSGGDGQDLDITSDMKVEAGDYRYGNVHIYNGGTLCFEDQKIDFWASAILIENTGSLIAGSSAHPIGQIGGQLTIHLYGQDQGPGGRGIACKTDAFCGVPDTVWNAGDSAKVALPGGVSDYFYPYEPLMFDNADPQAYFGYKVLGVGYGGSLALFGQKGASYAGTLDETDSGTSWVRLASTLEPTDNTLILDRPVDWAEGDQIVVTTTDYLPGHSEQFTIETVSADKQTITVKESAQYTHNGDLFLLTDTAARKKGYKRLGLDITVAGQPAAETRAAVALLTRSIRIVSAGDDLGEDFPPETQLFPSTEAPGKQHPYYFGGHVMIRQGVEKAQIQGVEFYQLGQGGRMGRYPVHFHFARKTPPDTFVKDSSIHDAMTRWITLHATQDVRLERNVGYKSIGHGFYLEDGTEINNKLYSNIGIFARAAVDNAQNPRQVPGILASPPELTPNSSLQQPDFRQVDLVPYHSDYDHPTVFWIMNGWNDFVGNMAAGAGTCGACYWLVPGANSGNSRQQKWESYAAMQQGLGRAATTPLKSFRGNYCSTAMNAFNTVANTTQCNGVEMPLDGNGKPIFNVLTHVDNPLAPARLLDLGKPLENIPPTPNPAADNYYPQVDPGGGRFPTRCDGATADCSTVPVCANGPGHANCMVTVLDRFTSAFNWTETNFAAIWLRPQWYLVTNSVLSDVQNAGLTFVTGGDYTNASTIEGHWALARKNVFIGHTQPDNPFAANGGPVNPASGLKCDTAAGNHCLLEAEGVAYPLSNFGVNQRLFNIYDGPAYEESNAYLDISTTLLDDCQPGSGPNNACSGSQWMYGRALGVPRNDADQCYLPNAAIGWKQPNGFYYPPAFHSRNLFFDKVDIRHFVIEPLFQPGTFKTDATAAEQRYCTRNEALFEGFTDIDRQTELNDDDGSLTGYSNSISINEDPFFNAPVEAVECRSDGTVKTSPYDYVSTVIYPHCAQNNSCLAEPAEPWHADCAGPHCYGVPLYRQLLTAQENTDSATPNIKMMGQGISQRNTLTVNNGVYYVDTTVSADQQRASGTSNLSVFRDKETYYLFLLYAKPSTRQTYQIYVGDDFDPASDIQAVRAQIKTAPLTFESMPDWPWETPELNNGVLTVTLDLSAFESQFEAAKSQSCQPESFCDWNTSTQQCLSSAQFKQDHPDLSAAELEEYDAVCEWAVIDSDCPAGGCYGISFTLPDTFRTLSAAEHADPISNPRPLAACFPSDDTWDIKWGQHAVPDLAGAECFNAPVEDTQFCDLQTKALFSTNVIIGSARSEHIQGTHGDDMILGLEGDDVLEGLDGHDWIFGGPGNDQLHGGAGSDFLHGEDGHDVLRGGDHDDSLDGGEGHDMLHGEQGEDVLTGGDGDDFLHGGEGDDLISGGEGHDICATAHGPSGCEAAF